MNITLITFVLLVSSSFPTSIRGRIGGSPEQEQKDAAIQERILHFLEDEADQVQDETEPLGERELKNGCGSKWCSYIYSYQQFYCTHIETGQRDGPMKEQDGEAYDYWWNCGWEDYKDMKWCAQKWGSMPQFHFGGGSGGGGHYDRIQRIGETQKTGKHNKCSSRSSEISDKYSTGTCGLHDHGITNFSRLYQCVDQSNHVNLDFK